MSARSEIRGLVRRHGVGGAVKTIAERVSPWSKWSTEFVWYRLDTEDPERPRRELKEGFVLRRGSVDDMDLLNQLPADQLVAALTPELVSERLSDGASLWIVEKEGKAAFCCWNFYGSAPVRGAEGGVVRLPDDAFVLEDSISSPDFRGQGVAPGAWTAIADANRDEGRRNMITKVTVENEPSRKAVEKAGFKDVARLSLSGPVWRTKIRVDLRTDDPALAWMKDVERN